MAWPKWIKIGALEVPVDSWDEVIEAAHRLGQLPEFVSGEREQRPNSFNSAHAPTHSDLNHGDRVLLAQFYEGKQRGVLTSQIAPLKLVWRWGSEERLFVQPWTHGAAESIL
jgi:hypothetical protein